MTCCRLVSPDPTSNDFFFDGVANMSMDEALLRTCSQTGQSCLRFYGWKPATLSLGYFQSLSDRDCHPPSANCQIVRRASGGGAILHDQELTYCFGTPVQSRWGSVDGLYASFHETLVESLQSQQVRARLHEEKDGLSDESFLCFQRRSAGDITLDGNKIVGSAQRRWKHALLQHGSILLRRSEFAPELPGIAELSGITLDVETLVADWLGRLGRRLEVEFQTSIVNQQEILAAQHIRVEKFAHPAWLTRR